MDNTDKSNKAKVVKSSYIKAYSYDSDSMDLEITFNNGTELTYAKVSPSDISRVFDAPGSIGSKFHKIIAKQYKASSD